MRTAFCPRSILHHSRIPLAALLISAVLLSGCTLIPHPHQAAAAFRVAQTLEAQGKTAEALASYQAAARDDARGPLAAQAFLKAGDLAMVLHRYVDAVAAYGAVANLPGEPRVAGGDAKALAQSKGDGAAGLLDRENAKDWQYQVMDFMVRSTGRIPWFSYAFAILVFTVVIKAALTPLTIRQLQQTRAMQRIQPLLKEIQDKYRDKPDELNRRMMALYKEQGVNPMGCGFNMAAQMGVMFILYRVIREYNYQFSKGTFLWVGSSLSHQYPQFLATNLAKPDTPLLILYAISMYISQKLMVVPTGDAQQQQQQQMMAVMMPAMFLIFLKSFPSAFILYWLLFNMMTTLQQMWLLRQAGPAPPAAPIARIANPDDSPDGAKGLRRPGGNGRSPQRSSRRRANVRRRS